MGDDKPKPIDDLKQGLGLLFRAAKGAVEKLPTEKIEDVAKDAAKEVGRAFETLGSELDKAIHGGKATHSAPPAPAPPAAAAPEEEKKPDPPFDDAYAPEPPKT